jgi:toluene monooxygenase system protein A
MFLIAEVAGVSSRQIWWKDRDNLNHTTVVERFLLGEIQPMDVPGILAYMGITPDVAGDDADGYAWAKDYATTSGNPELIIAGSGS